MIVSIEPSNCFGSVQVPASKSLCHRSVIAAALANGTSTITHVSYSQDIDATIEGMCALQADIKKDGDTLTIQGSKNVNSPLSTHIDCNESGSTLRFFIPIFAMSGKPITFTGKGRLMDRPQNVYASLFEEKGLTFIQENGTIQIEGKLIPGTYELNGDVSSQFISGLLFSLPLLDGDSHIIIKEPFESRSYVNLTIDVLTRFGVEIAWQSSNHLSIKGNQTYKSTTYEVDSDDSQAAFFVVLGALHNGITIHNMKVISHQGDRAIVDILRNAGANIAFQDNTMQVSSASLKGCEIDLANCPDLGPILMVLGAFSSGTTHIYNAGRLRYKESDRIEAMETELKKLGVDIHSSEDEIWINGKSHYEGNVMFTSHNDHRIVMSLAVASTLCDKPCMIEDAQVINKSYPNFFEDLKKVNGKVVVLDDTE